jgi:hypothetical protein
MMSRVRKGIIAGLAATVVISILEAANTLLGPWSATLPRTLSFVLQQDGDMLTGWVAHFVAGTLVLGPLFGVLCPRLPTDTSESKGVIFAVGAWIAMSLTLLPASGLGPFAASAGFGSIAWLFLVHVIYGVVLGRVYGVQVQREKHAAHHPPPGAAVA